MESRHFAGDLFFQAENVTIILRKAAHAHHAVQGARRLVAMALTEFAVAQWQVAVAAHAIVENLDMARAIHRLQRIGAVFRFRDEHVFTVIIPVTGFFPQATIKDLRRLDFLVAVDLVHIAHVLLDLLPDRPAFRVPEDQAWRLFLEMEEIELLAQLAVIALFRLFQVVQIQLLVFLLGPGRAIDTLQHLVFRVAAPVGAGQLHQLEDLQLARRWHVGAAAQVRELAFGIQRHFLVSRDRADQLSLVRLADALEVLDGFVARNDLARDLLILLGQFRHFLFDCDQVFRRERALVGEVIIKAVVDHGTDGHLRVREQFLDGIGQQVGRRMADHFQAIGILVRDNRQFRVLLDQIGSIDQLAVNLARQGSLGQAGTNIGRNLGHGDRAVKLTGGTIGKSDCKHIDLHIGAGAR